MHLGIVLTWGLESPQNPPTRMSALRGAGFPACGFRRLSSRLCLREAFAYSRTMSRCARLAKCIVGAGFQPLRAPRSNSRALTQADNKSAIGAGGEAWQRGRRHSPANPGASKRLYAATWIMPFPGGRDAALNVRQGCLTLRGPASESRWTSRIKSTTTWLHVSIQGATPFCRVCSQSPTLLGAGAGVAWAEDFQSWLKEL